jgi:hypothetical protein
MKQNLKNMVDSKREREDFHEQHSENIEVSNLLTFRNQSRREGPGSRPSNNSLKSGSQIGSRRKKPSSKMALPGMTQDD